MNCEMCGEGTFIFLGFMGAAFVALRCRACHWEILVEDDGSWDNDDEA